MPGKAFKTSLRPNECALHQLRRGNLQHRSRVRSWIHIRALRSHTLVSARQQAKLLETFIDTCQVLTHRIVRVRVATYSATLFVACGRRGVASSFSISQAPFFKNSIRHFCSLVSDASFSQPLHCFSCSVEQLVCLSTRWNSASCAAFMVYHFGCRRLTFHGVSG